MTFKFAKTFYRMVAEAQDSKHEDFGLKQHM